MFRRAARLEDENEKMSYFAGSTTVEESQTLQDEVEFTEGLTIDRGFISPYFVNDQERDLRAYL